MEKELHSERIFVERKVFFFDLKENKRGRFLKITEDVLGRRDTIIIPSCGFEAFASAVNTAIEVYDDLPPEESDDEDVVGDEGDEDDMDD